MSQDGPLAAPGAARSTGTAGALADGTGTAGALADGTGTGLLTDHYELTMVSAALRSGAAGRRAVFEVFARELPGGRRYGVVAGTGRFLRALEAFRFAAEEISFLRGAGIVDEDAARFLASYRFRGDIWGYAEGDCYFPGSPILVVEGTFAEAVVLETLALSIFNHDCAVASAASRMVTAAGGRPIIEMGSRRTHERAAVAAARAAYLAGFATTSNLRAGYEFGVPTAGTSAHAFTMVHDDERQAFKVQLDALGKGTTLLVDTYDVARAVRTAVELAGPDLGAVRIDSGDLRQVAHAVRAELDSLGAKGTRIVITGDLDEHAIAGARFRAGRRLRRRHRPGHGLRCADGGAGLQARRQGGPGRDAGRGRQALGRQADDRRPEVGGARARRDRDGQRRDSQRPPSGRRRPRWP